MRSIHAVNVPHNGIGTAGHSEQEHSICGLSESAAVDGPGRALTHYMVKFTFFEQTPSSAHGNHVAVGIERIAVAAQAIVLK